jgi:hypothetical protein
MNPILKEVQEANDLIDRIRGKRPDDDDLGDEDPEEEEYRPLLLAGDPHLAGTWIYVDHSTRSKKDTRITRITEPKV